MIPRHFKWTKNVSLEGTKNHSSQEWMLSWIFQVQHTALLCFISCFNYYISITTDMKNHCNQCPSAYKSLCYAERSQSWDLCLVFTDLPNSLHLTQDRVGCPRIHLQHSLDLIHLNPVSCSKVPRHRQPHTQATQAQGVIYYHRRKMSGLHLHSILCRG